MHAVLVVLEATEVQQGRAHGRAAEHAEQIRVEAEQRHHHGQRNDPRHHEEFHGRDAQGRQRVDFLADPHRAQLRGERRSRATGHDDGRHHRPHFARRGDADEVGHVDLRAERAQLYGPDVREDGPDEEGDQGNDRQRVRADVLHHDEQIGPPDPCAAGGESNHGDGRVADEREHVDRGLRRADRSRPDTVEQTRSLGAVA